MVEEKRVGGKSRDWELISDAFSLRPCGVSNVSDAVGDKLQKVRQKIIETRGVTIMPRVSWSVCADAGVVTIAQIRARYA